MLVKMKPKNMIPFDRNKNAALFYDGDNDKFVCAYGYQPLPSQSAYAYDELCISDHPLEALSHYESSFYPSIRIAYGDWLEGIGYQRYSGEKLGFTAAQQPKAPARPGAHCQNCRYGENGSGTCPERYNKELCANGSPIDPTKEE